MRKNFPDEVRKTVSHDKPKKHSFASRDIAKECIMYVPPTPPPPLSSGYHLHLEKLAVIWKIPNSFEIMQKIGSDLGKSGQL